MGENETKEEQETELDSVVDSATQVRTTWFQALKSGDLNTVQQLIDSKQLDINVLDEVSHIEFMSDNKQTLR